MKITKSQLKQIIKEELESVLSEKEGLWANIHAKRERGEAPGLGGAGSGEEGSPASRDTGLESGDWRREAGKVFLSPPQRDPPLHPALPGSQDERTGGHGPGGQEGRWHGRPRH